MTSVIRSLWCTGPGGQFQNNVWKLAGFSNFCLTWHPAPNLRWCLSQGVQFNPSQRVILSVTLTHLLRPHQSCLSLTEKLCPSLCYANELSSLTWQIYFFFNHRALKQCYIIWALNEVAHLWEVSVCRFFFFIFHIHSLIYSNFF